MGKLRRQRPKPSRSRKTTKSQLPLSQTPPKVTGKASDAVSLGSELNGPLTKQDKIKLRRLRLLSRMDAVRRGRSSDVVKQSSPDVKDEPKKRPPRVVKPKKGTEKASVRQKKFLRGVKMFKKLMESDEFKKNPKKIITKRVKSVVKSKKM